MTEHDLITRVLAGDPAAERTLYERYVDQVWRMTYRLAGDADRAADWTQETFLKVYQRLQEFRGEAKLGSWIGAVAMSVSLDGLRKVRRRAAREAPLEEGHQVAASTDRPRDADLKDRLYRAIDELADGYRAVFVLHELEGYSHEEIAEMLHVTPGTSKAQLHRARARLRESLAAFV